MITKFKKLGWGHNTTIFFFLQSSIIELSTDKAENKYHTRCQNVRWYRCQTCSVGTDHGYGYGYGLRGHGYGYGYGFETMGMGTGTGTRPWVRVWVRVRHVTKSWVRVRVWVRDHRYGYGYGYGTMGMGTMGTGMGTGPGCQVADERLWV